MAGELDVATAPQLSHALSETPDRARLIVIDLREVVFIASAGIHVIIDASAQAVREGRQLVLVRPESNVDAVFALTGTVDRLDASLTISSACAQLDLVSTELP